ncbi:hypothetical protein GCM10009106_27190 [Sphingomonas japonica]
MPSAIAVAVAVPTLALVAVRNSAVATRSAGAPTIGSSIGAQADRASADPAIAMVIERVCTVFLPKLLCRGNERARILFHRDAASPRVRSTLDR